MNQKNLPALARQIPTPTPELSKSMTQQDLLAHREKIVFEVRVVLSAYFQPSESHEVVTGQLAWWADTLQDWSIEQIVYALRRWNEDKPEKRPTPGHIKRALKEMRGKAEAARMSKPDPEQPSTERVSGERAEEIMREVGISVKRFE